MLRIPGGASATTDPFPVGVALCACAVLACFVHYDFVLTEVCLLSDQWPFSKPSIHNSYHALQVLWAFSCYVEAIALLPQIFATLESKKRSLGNLHIFFLVRKAQCAWSDVSRDFILTCPPGIVPRPANRRLDLCFRCGASFRLHCSRVLERHECGLRVPHTSTLLAAHRRRRHCGLR